MSSYGASPIVVKHRVPDRLFKAACVHCPHTVDAIDAQLIRSHAYDRSQAFMGRMKCPILCLSEANCQNPKTGIGDRPVGFRNRSEWREICWVDDVLIDQGHKKRHNCDNCDNSCGVCHAYCREQLTVADSNYCIVLLLRVCLSQQPLIRRGSARNNCAESCAQLCIKSHKSAQEHSAHGFRALV